MTGESEEGGRTQWVPNPIREVERLKNVVEDDIENMEAAEQDFEETVDEDLGNDLLLYFILAHSTIERYSNNILWSRFNSEEYQPEEDTTEILESLNDDRDYLSQSVREDLLFSESVIDPGLKSQMAETRRTRNSLVHDPHERVFLSSIEDVASKIDIAWRAATAMDQKWTDELQRGDAEVIE